MTSLYEVWRLATEWYEHSEQTHIKNKEMALDAFIAGYDEGFKAGLEAGREEGEKSGDS